MKNVNVNPEDSLRLEYKRSDFGELTKGRYAATEFDFHQLVSVLIGCIAEDEALTFTGHPQENLSAKHESGDWTYEIDNANQITLHYWVSQFESISEVTSNSRNVITAADRNQLHDAWLKSVTALKARVREHKAAQ